MPKLTASGDVFAVDGSVLLDYEVTRMKAAAGLRLHFEGELEFCHGIDAELSGKGLAEITAEAPPAMFLEQYPILLLTTGQVHGEAFVGAGGRVTANFMVDLFDSFGFSAMASAQAKAGVSGRLSVGLSTQAIAFYARQLGPLLNSAAYDIFIAFLNEVVVEAGVWGQASVSAYGEAFLNLKGSLSDDANSGFYVEAGAGAGYGGGTSWDFYAGMRFKEAKRFYLYAVSRITREIADEARKRVPEELQPLIPLFELTFPVLMNSSYEIGQKTTIAALSDPASMTRAFTDAFIGELQRVIVDCVVNIAATQIEEWIAASIDRAMDEFTGGSENEDVTTDGTGASSTGDPSTGGSSPAERTARRQQLKAELQQLLVIVQDQEMNWETAKMVMTPIINCLTTLFPNQAHEWRRPIAVLWTAATCAEVLRVGGRNLSLGVEASFIGLGNVAAGVVMTAMPDAPAIVVDDWVETLGDGLTVSTVADAFTYLIETGVATAIPILDPNLQTLFDLLEEKTGVTRVDLIQGVLRGAIGRDLAHSDLYRKLRTFTKDVVDQFLLSDLIPKLRETLGPSDDATIWIDEVAEPTLRMSSSFVFDRLDDFVDMSIDDRSVDFSSRSPLVNSFRAALSHLVAKVVVRNVVVLSDILLAHSQDALHEGFLALAEEVRRSPSHPMTELFVPMTADILPAGLAVPDEIGPATQDLVVALLSAGADAFGPQILTMERRARQRTLMIRIFDSIDGEVDYFDPSKMDDYFQAVAECSYIPDPEALGGLLLLDAEIIGEVCGILAPRVSQALGTFFLRLTTAWVHDMDVIAREFVGEATRGTQLLWLELQERIRAVHRLVEELRLAVQAVADALTKVGDLLKDAGRRAEILSALRQHGINTAVATVESTPLFSLKPASQQQAEIGMAVLAFTTAFDIARPVLDQALYCLSDVAGSLSVILRVATDPEDFKQRLKDAVKDSVVAAVNSAPGLSLPGEVTAQSVGQVAADALMAFGGFVSALAEAWKSQEDEAHAEAAVDHGRQDEKAARDCHNDALDRQRDLVGSLPEIEIVSPLQMAGARPPVYGPMVEALISINGAQPSYVQPGSPRRVFVALNGLVVPAGRLNYSYSNSGLVIRVTFAMAAGGLKSGLNSLECSVADGSHEITRKSVVFAVNAAMPSAGRIVIDAVASRFNAPGDDHREAASETVVIQNAGSAPIDLAGWSIRDAIGHAYLLGDLTLMPNRRLSLHTGSGRDQLGTGDIELFAGKRRAIWNNSGDTVLVIDSGNIVRASHTYLAGEVH